MVFRDIKKDIPAGPDFVPPVPDLSGTGRGFVGTDGNTGTFPVCRLTGRLMTSRRIVGVGTMSVLNKFF